MKLIVVLISPVRSGRLSFSNYSERRPIGGEDSVLSPFRIFDQIIDDSVAETREKRGDS